MRILFFALCSPWVCATSMDWQGELQTGLRYDSQVAIAELDNNSQQADTAWLVNATLNGSLTTGSANWSAGYQLQQQRYQSLSNYNVVTHTVHGGVQLQQHQWLTTLQLHHAQANLAGDPFLQLQLAHVGLGHTLGSVGFVQLVWQGQRKTLHNASERDASSQSLGVDYLQLSTSGNTTWHGSVQWDRETAQQTELSYQGWQAQLSYLHKSVLWTRPQQWQVRYQTWQRHYDTTSMASRHDTRFTVQANWQLDVATDWQLQWSVERSRNQSTLSTLNYQEWVTSTQVSWQF